MRQASIKRTLKNTRKIYHNSKNVRTIVHSPVLNSALINLYCTGALLFRTNFLLFHTNFLLFWHSCKKVPNFHSGARKKNRAKSVTFVISKKYLFSVLCMRLCYDAFILFPIFFAYFGALCALSQPASCTYASGCRSCIKTRSCLLYTSPSPRD